MNKTSGLNTWKGIRFAAPATGNRRWQRPQVPEIDRDAIQNASDFAARCPQSQAAGLPHPPSNPGNEDCLFLNVYSPANAKNLPVLVWIHGGGYGIGDGQQDLSNIITANDGGFLVRLEAFKYLSSREVFQRGAVNADILDQNFALQWVQAYIKLFGGDPARVTIAGLSAGAGFVLMQCMAEGGALGTTLFTNAISASPFLPRQHAYDDAIPTQAYTTFAARAGCMSNTADDTFDCLVTTDTLTLQKASANVSESGVYGTWGFLPVTDGVFIQQRPSQQLVDKRVNGRTILVGNNAHEGSLFTPQNITSSDDLYAWLKTTLPLFTESDLANAIHEYSEEGSVDVPDALDSPSTRAQRTADTIYAEITFVCPSYWLAAAFDRPGSRSFKYQYSVLPAIHGSDSTGYFGPEQPNQGLDFVKAFMSIWGNFIATSNPSISERIAAGNSSLYNAGSNWPAFRSSSPIQLNLN
ncbi:carboxylesterase 2 [Colletotrichum tofieldiae]|uniref:Carboxylic ester hydrolase n=1 Tax=Colletotrichum tofieldiae TaxID=708197 RepID=A0A166LVR4_9PEZI|nr:carboxylesterase 2 [Colletotrichum tofieldiae]